MLVYIRFIALLLSGFAAPGENCLNAQENSVAVAPAKSGAEPSGTAGDSSNDPHAKAGNITPQAVKLNAEQEARILKDVKVVDGFDVTVFAAPPMMNYPVFVAAAPDGTVYVSSDGNGSLGRDPDRGRVIRLRDLDGDGRADETKVFCKVDAPRGLVWDRDRLYLMHPPHLSAFVDNDGDGVADEEKILVKNLAFGYDQRPADHTTNGVTLAIDGWLYIAGGDFGFLNAEGADGRTLTHRGGGVIRVKTDGTGLELYCTGTRNILEVAISPRLDLFARDNTNDGGGWNVRFHHLIPLGDHGYPRLYKNFADETIPPLADYGGGSGCGAVYIDEPGFGKWNDAPFTADWGSGALFHHQVKPRGATFEETRPPEPFVKMTRPTDADVDAMGRVYVASWKGATFKWEGPNVGYIVALKPKNHQAERLPDFAKATEAELSTLRESPSYRRRLEAHQELRRRGSSFAENHRNERMEERSAARNLLDSFLQGATDETIIEAFAHADPLVTHSAVRTAAKRGLADGCLDKLNDADAGRDAALRALAMMHTPHVVNHLTTRLATTTSADLRRGILFTLCRLHFNEGHWKGDSWGTRPDTRGPYYQPELWSESARIVAVLTRELETATPAEAARLVKEMNRNRIQSEKVLHRILALAREDANLIPDAVTQIAQAERTPVEAVPLLIEVVRGGAHDDAQPATMESAANALPLIGRALSALARSDARESCLATIDGLQRMEEIIQAQETRVARLPDRAAAPQETKFIRELSDHLDAAARAFVESRTLENHHQLLEAEAEKIGTARARWADAALLKLSATSSGSPEARELSRKALDAGWPHPARRRQIIEAAVAIKHRPYAEKIIAATDDPDVEVQRAARAAVRALKLEKVEDKTPKIAALTPAEVLIAVLQTKGRAATGELVFAKACVSCHTTDMNQPPKGPFLGNIAQTYKRRELAEAILDPNKSIAQGFTTNMVSSKDGAQIVGFVTDESGDAVTLRDITAKEHTFKKQEIVERSTLPTSMMPPGLMLPFSVREFASLLDYLESLSPPQ